MSDESYTIAMVGAGPAALYGSAKLAEAGHDVVIVNRDIKPGGLAEFGIYPTKTKMKGGLRMMFKRILDKDNIHYFGNVKVGDEADISLDALHEMGFDAVVVAVGAQGTRWLGLPGEEADEVMHAKDLVYHYNDLPPFSEREYPIGDDVCVVGLGNVALDIIHYLTCEEDVDVATTVARRGPAERACTKRELKIVSGAMDVDQIRREFETISGRLSAIGQEPEEEFEDLTKYSDEPLEKESSTDFRMRFLCSPDSIERDDEGRVTGLVCEHTKLVESDGDRPGIERLGEYETIPCDSVVFAIGDTIEPSVGLPLDPEHGHEFATVSEPWDEHPDRPRYMVYDPQKEEPMWDTFVVGWARKASEGLVGKAKADSEQGCDEILAYLDGEFPEAPEKTASTQELLERLLSHFDEQGVRYVTYEEVERLEEAEERVAEKRDLEEFKFSSTEKMLDVLKKAS